MESTYYLTAFKNKDDIILYLLTKLGNDTSYLVMKEGDFIDLIFKGPDDYLFDYLYNNGFEITSYLGDEFTAIKNEIINWYELNKI